MWRRGRRGTAAPATRPTEPSFTADAILAVVPQAMYVVDRTRTIRYWNAAAEQLTGYSAADVVGRRCRDGVLNHVDGQGRLLCTSLCPLLKAMTDGRPHEDGVYLHHRDGHRVPVDVHVAPLLGEDGVAYGAVETFTTDRCYAAGRRAWERRVAQAEIEANTDQLTGLMNRRAALRELDRHVAAAAALPDTDVAARSGADLAVLFVDVDHFKEVNDRYGHAVGDQVLHAVATTLQGCARADDVVSRWGGEEFLVLAPLTAAPADDVLLLTPSREGGGHVGEDGSSEGAGRPRAELAAAAALAERLRRLAGTAWTNSGRATVQVTVSIGVAVLAPGESATGVIDRADRAMLAAKAEGRNGVVVHPGPDLVTTAADQATTTADQR